MSNLQTKYLGLDLKNPIIIGASNIVTDLDNLQKLEKAGAAAVVYKSLFEEQIQYESYQMQQESEAYSHWDAEHETMFPEMDHAGPSQHLLELEKARSVLSIPLIGSLNCILNETWVDYAMEMEKTGIDALELNFYTHITDPNQSGDQIVENQVETLQRVKEALSIPVSVKLSPFYTNPLQVINKLNAAGADGFILFNRLFQPDIDIIHEAHHFPYNFSQSNDSRLALRYAGLLHGSMTSSICSNTGIFFGEDVIKMLLAGADVVQIVSAIYKKGISYLPKLIEDIEKWMENKKYSSISEFRGKLSKRNMTDPFAYKRAQYVDILLRSDLLMTYHPKESDEYI
ncbi:MAG: dihydroorotate dehydrogenase-like protein [Cyclobacteriaceae bacterium]